MTKTVTFENYVKALLRSHHNDIEVVGDILAQEASTDERFRQWLFESGIAQKYNIMPD